jgi:hypothetical protein
VSRDIQPLQGGSVARQVPNDLRKGSQWQISGRKLQIRQILSVLPKESYQ